MLHKKESINPEVAELERELANLKARQKSEQLSDSMKSILDETFGHRELYYVQSHDRVWEYRRVWGGQPWKAYSRSSIENEHPMLTGKGGIPAFMAWLRQRNAYHHISTYSFADQDSSVLNHMRTDHWLKPLDGDLHEMYDVLMLALGGGRQEGKDHIEQLIACKYRNPADFLLPCVNWYDQGGVGKNLFIDGMLGGIFGADQVRSAGLENLTGNFNGIIRGKTVILMNEAASKKVDMERLKNLVGQPTLQINEKFIPIDQIDNTPLYFIATNDPMSIPLEGKNSDRRWSIIHLVESIEAFVARHLNCGEDRAKDLWVNKYADELKEPENLQAWLNHILKKWAHVVRPEPLHGEDYEMSVAMRQEIDPVNAALTRLVDMDTWTPLVDLYLHVTGEETLKRDYRYQRFCAGINGEIKKRKLPLRFERDKKYSARFSRKPSAGIIVRHEDYPGPLTKDHFRLESEYLSI